MRLPPGVELSRTSQRQDVFWVQPPACGRHDHRLGPTPQHNHRICLPNFEQTSLIILQEFSLNLLFVRRYLGTISALKQFCSWGMRVDNVSRLAFFFSSVFSTIHGQAKKEAKLLWGYTVALNHEFLRVISARAPGPQIWVQIKCLKTVEIRCLH